MSYVLKTKCKYKVDNTGTTHELPCLITKHGVLTSHVQYLYSKRAKSQSWVEKSVHSMILLIKYINANTQSLPNKQKIMGSELLTNFTTALNLGTVDLNGNDPSGLFWKDRQKKDAKDILDHISQYTDFLGEKNKNKLPINPFRRASFIEEKMNWCAYYHHKGGVFLNHLDNKQDKVEKTKFVRLVKSDQPDVVTSEKVVRFPKSKIENLLNYGFITLGNKYPDYKNQLITMLMHYGGLRLSETFHIYVNDIIFDKKHSEAIVRIFHPSKGCSPESKKHSRKTFLQECYSLLPRDMYPKNLRLHAGWKNPVLTSTDGYFEVIFSQSAIAKIFYKTWIQYLKYQRINPPLNFQHPFAFTNSKGEPETIKNFRRMHNDAVKRIGLTACKDEGTSCHGHRHSYGYDLSKLGFTQVEIQKSMHHRSPKSCLVYIQPTSEDIRAKMRILEC